MAFNSLQELVVQLFFVKPKIQICIILEPDVVHYVQWCSGKYWTLCCHHHTVKTSDNVPEITYQQYNLTSIVILL